MNQQTAPALRSSLFRRINGRTHRVTSVFFTLPFALLFFTFTLLPILSSIVLSFSYFNMLQTPVFIGLDNYIRLLLEDDIFLTALRNTFVFALLTGPLSYFLSFVFAWFITDFRRGLRTALTFLFYAPSLAGNVYFIWTYIFSDDAVGLLNSTLLRTGLLRDSVQWLSDPRYSMGVVIVRGCSPWTSPCMRQAPWTASKTAFRNCGTSPCRRWCRNCCLALSCRSAPPLLWGMKP